MSADVLRISDTSMLVFERHVLFGASLTRSTPNGRMLVGESLFPSQYGADSLSEDGEGYGECVITAQAEIASI